MLDAASILTRAQEQVGVADTDAGVAQNLERLVQSLNASFPTTVEGEQAIDAMLLRDSINRLESLKWIQEVPEIAEEEIKNPVFLCGLPRSGTTYFQYLFDRDPRFRLIRTWQSVLPSPPPAAYPPSVAQRQSEFAEMQRKRPHFEGFEALHLYDEDGSDECHAFMEQSYGAAGLHNLYRVPAFFDYLLDEADLEQTYRIHKRQLQCLQWKQEAKPWALKYPNHVIGIDAILNVYPDAHFAMTHRDPVQTLASICKMTYNLRSMRAAEPVDRHEVGQDMLHFISRHIDRIIAFDKGPHADRVVHVDYYALVADPVGEMRHLHRGLGLETPDSVAQAVGAWQAANPKNARGANEYALAQYGLEEAPVRERFAEYMQRFSVQTETDGLADIAGQSATPAHTVPA